MSEDLQDGMVTLLSALSYFQDSPVVTGDGNVPLPVAHADQVGAMVADQAHCWDGYHGAIAGMFLMAQAAERFVRDLAHEGCEECTEDADVMAEFLTIMLQFPRALVSYELAGLDADEAEDAFRLFGELGLEAPEGEEE